MAQIKKRDPNKMLEALTEISTSDDNVLFLEMVDTPQPRKGVLATLKGPFSDTTKKTRNARRYTSPLWKMVLGLEYVQEMFATNTFFGEADHPSKAEQRLEVYLAKVSHVITSLVMNDSTGILEGSLDVLDTPSGRIIKTLIDYGCKLGVSSRGFGKTVNQGGESVIDKDTYRFVTFDIVALPANVNMRLEDKQTFESASYESSLIEALGSQVDGILTRNDPMEIQAVYQLFESMDTPDFAPLSDKLKQSLESTDIELIKNDLMEAYQTINGLKVQIQTLTDDLKIANEAKTNPDDTSQMDGKDFVDQVSSKLESLMGEMNVLKQTIDAKVSGTPEVADQMIRLQNELKDLEEQFSKKEEFYKSDILALETVNLNLTSEVSTLTEDLRVQTKLNESISGRINIKDKQLMRMSDTLTESKNVISDFRTKLSEVTAENATLDESLDDMRNLLKQSKTHARGLEIKVNELTESASEDQKTIKNLELNVSTKNDVIKSISEAYVKLRCGQLSINESTVISNLGEVSSLDDIELKLMGEARRVADINKLPIRLNRTPSVLNESSEGAIEVTTTKTAPSNPRLIGIVQSVGGNKIN